MNDDLRKKIEALATTHNKSQIARELGVNINTVSWYCYKYNITTTRAYGLRTTGGLVSRSEIISKIKELAPTHNTRMIAKKLGVKQHTIRTLCRTEKIKALSARKEEKINATNAKKLSATESKNDFEKRLLHLRQKALSVAYKRGYTNEAEDFASWLTEQALKGSSVDNIRYRFIDYLRQRFGRSIDYDSVVQQNKLAHNHSKDRISGTEAKPDDGFIDLPADQKQKSILNELKYTNKISKACIILHYEYGLTQTELAKVFSVSLPRINQIINLEIERLKNKHK